jgi:glycogen debranching enzyme
VGGAGRQARQGQDPRRVLGAGKRRHGSVDPCRRRRWLKDRGYYALALDGDKAPVDDLTSNIGQLRYGYRDEAATIAVAILEAAQYFLGRLPETFAGYARTLTEFPVEYPTACSSEAWATGAPLLLLRVLLGLEPKKGEVAQDPVLPERISQLALRGLSGPAGIYDAVAGEAVRA